jgi:hypothetical protein
MNQIAAEELKQAATLVAEEDAPLSPKWVEEMDAGVTKVLYYLDQLKGKSDPNRYRIRSRLYEKAKDVYMKAIFDKVCEVDESFARKSGTRDKFVLANHMEELRATVHGDQE